MNSPSPARPGRTFELKILVAGFLVLALAHGLRLRLAILNWEVLPEFGAAASPLYLALSGGVWALACLVCGAGLYFRQRWAPTLSRVISVVLAAWYWVERLALSQTPESQQNWLFMLAFTVLALAFTFGTLALNAQKAFFEE